MEPILVVITSQTLISNHFITYLILSNMPPYMKGTHDSYYIQSHLFILPKQGEIKLLIP